MDFILPNHGLQTVLDLSNDIFIVVESDSLKLLDWNPAFASMGFPNIAHDKGLVLTQSPYAPHFSGLEKIIATHTRLLQAGEDPRTFVYLPLNTNEISSPLRQSISAKVVYMFEDSKAILMQICVHDEMSLTSKIALQNLERRDTLLKATSKVAQELLSISDNFDLTVNNVLKILGHATNVDRVYVWSIHEAPNPLEDKRLYTSQLYEWSEGAEPQQGNDLVKDMLVEEGIPTWIDTFLAGKCVNNLVKNMHPSEREVLEPQGIVSILTAPIMFHGHLWGFVGFDNCHSEYTWSPAEEDILRTAGTLIGTAIYSRRTNEALYIAQERFCGVEEATGDIIWSVDENQNIDYISHRLVAVLQYHPHEVIGKPFSALLLHPEEFQYTATADDYIMRDFELRARCKDGSIKWLRSSCKYIFDDKGKLLYGFGSSSDVTRVHDVQDALHIANMELEEAIKIANDLVESANKANAIKGNFLANMSHEIRTPMNAVVGITHLLKHTELNPKQLEYIDKINTSSASLLNIINDILDFSKIQDGNMVIEKHLFSIKYIIDDIEQMAKQWIEDKNVQLTVNIDPEVDEHYIGDSVRLNQILTSLTTNAIKFTQEGSVHIDVHVESGNNDTVLLHCSVKDTGMGIDPKQLETLFEGFTQADISNTRRFGGIGLGLALCRNLTVLMGGDIWCESELGKGSTFNFTCRLEKEHHKLNIPINELKEINIVAAFPSEQDFEQLKKTLYPLGYTHVLFAKDILSIKNFLDATEPVHIIILHSDFAEVLLMESVLSNNLSYFDNTPIIYFTEDVELKHDSFAVINALEPSIMHDTFVNVLGPNFEPDRKLFQQGFEELLRKKHSGKNILLVEDNEVNQMIAEAILEEVGFNVSVASDGVEGCELMYKKDFDLVIMDIQMPRMDGLTAAKKIRQDSKFDDIPIIAMTAHAMEEDREKSLNAGMNDHTTKPIDASQLFKVLLYWLDKRASEIKK